MVADSWARSPPGGMARMESCGFGGCGSLYIMAAGRLTFQGSIARARVQLLRRFLNIWLSPMRPPSRAAASSKLRFSSRRRPIGPLQTPIKLSSVSLDRTDSGNRSTAMEPRKQMASSAGRMGNSLRLHPRSDGRRAVAARNGRVECQQFDMYLGCVRLQRAGRITARILRTAGADADARERGRRDSRVCVT